MKQENSSICSISFHSSDSIRLLSFPEEDLNNLSELLVKSWPAGIQKESEYFEGYEFKLNGSPWTGEGQDAVNSKKVLIAILTFMTNNGWNLLQSIDLSRKSISMDTLYFERSSSDPDTKMFCISFNREDRLRIINDEGSSVVSNVKEAIKSYWPKGIGGQKDFYGSYEFKLNGTPWVSSDKDGIYTRLLILQIIIKMKELGYKLYSSIDISGGCDMECLIFRKISASWGQFH